MSLNYGEDWGYADNRLRGTVVTYEGYPIFIRNVEYGGVIDGQVFGTSKFKGQVLLLKDCDLTPVRLGYCNHNPNAVYIYRIPTRYYRQGLTEQVTAGKNMGRINRVRNGVSKPLVDCILNRYPAFDTCLESVVNDEATALAFGKRFAVASGRGKTINVHYRGDLVGKVDNNGEPSLQEKYKFLEEQLQESML